MKKRMAMVVAVAAGVSCGPDVQPPKGPLVTLFVSGVVSTCPGLTPGDPCPTAHAGLELNTELRAELSTPDFDVSALRGAAVASGGAAALETATGLPWTEVPVAESDVWVDLAELAGSRSEEPGAVYVVEVASAQTPRRALISLASGGGAAVWVNGELQAVSRYAMRGVNRNSDLLDADLQAGDNVILYKVRNDGTQRWQLQREWIDPSREDEILSAMARGGAYADLTAFRVLPDTATGVGIKGPRVHVEEGPTVRFRWRGLLGEILEEVDPAVGWPEWLPFPEAYTGAAMLEFEATDPSTGELVYLEQSPVFRRTELVRLARELLAVGPDDPGDPVLWARRDLARTAGADQEAEDVITDWRRAQAVVDLYRRVHAPDRFHTFPGLQAWGYRSPEDGTFQPFWLTVPPHADREGQPPAPVVLSLNHGSGPVFWIGRGASAGLVFGAAIRATATGVLGVVPHFRGEHRFGGVARVEIPALLDQVERYLPVDRDHLGLFAWSDHAESALDLAADPDVPLSHVGLVVPVVDGGERSVRPRLRAAVEVHPQAVWTLWTGADDERLPPERVEDLAVLMEEEGLDVTWVNVAHSTHEGMFFDVEGDLYRQVGEAAASGPGGGRGS